jgi:hypothetical protein
MTGEIFRGFERFRWNEIDFEMKDASILTCSGNGYHAVCLKPWSKIRGSWKYLLSSFPHRCPIASVDLFHFHWIDELRSADAVDYEEHGKIALHRLGLEGALQFQRPTSVNATTGSQSQSRLEIYGIVQLYYMKVGISGRDSRICIFRPVSCSISTKSKILDPFMAILHPQIHTMSIVTYPQRRRYLGTCR